MGKNYDPKQVSLILGTHIAEGFADGTFINLERNRDAFTLTKGASGEGARAKSNDKSARCTLTVMQSSLTNDYLSGIATADETSNGGQIPFLLKDNNGSTVAEGTACWVVKKPAVEYSNEITNREWVLEIDNCDILVGGIPA